MSHQLGDLQLAIMRELWSRDEATVAQVHEALLPQRGLALTTIATMLRKMEDKGVVRHRTEGRQFVYQPTVSQDQVSRSMISQLTDRLFGGDATALVSHLLKDSDIGADELDELRRMIEARRKAAKEAGRAD